MTPTMEEVAGWLREAAKQQTIIARAYHKLGWSEHSHDAETIGEYFEDCAARVEAMGWRPIEETPKDGTLIDLWESNTKERLPDCMWCKGVWRQFQNQEEEWVDVMYGEITHFMPIPKPPVKK